MREICGRSPPNASSLPHQTNRSLVRGPSFQRDRIGRSACDCSRLPRSRSPAPPERARGSDVYGGYVTIKSLDRGLYQVTLSQDAWLDVIQNDQFARSAGSSGRRDCPGLRKSVRFHLQATSTIIQVSSVESSDIVIMIRKIE